jgi:putative oxidoreductase
MFATLFKPKVDFAALLLRLGLAAVFVVHGYFKIVQAFPLIQQMSMQVQQIVGWTEFVAGIALALGLFSRLAALATIPIQVGAIILVTGKRAMTVTPFEATGADYTRVGPEYNGILIVAALAVILLGSGVVSLDHLIYKMFRGKKPQAAQEKTPEREPAGVGG